MHSFHFGKGFCRKPYSTLRCTAKSAEVIDGKGVADAPWLQRVRKYMKRKTLDKAVALGETMKAKEGESRGGGRKCGK